MDERQIDLSKYRLQEAEDTLKVADRCFQDGFYKDSINLRIIQRFIVLRQYWHLEQLILKGIKM